MRSKGNDIKTGFSKVTINGIWKYWRDLEKEKGKDNDVATEV